MTRIKFKHTKFKIQKCRVCGCTENNCRQCIEKTGKACYWIEKDLCSACEDIVANKIKNKNSKP